MSELDFDRLKSIQGEPVDITDAQNHRISLMLEAVEPGLPNDATWDSISIRFRSNTDLIIPQGYYTIHHRDLGTHMLFVIPRDSGRYQSMITRERT